ncbi:MAG TPA: hypothetical protein VGR28_01535 [Candidatus Thermoplasmatota archaeon]|jgi:hypothetical protein|nr:hypothetical protein [Candidatus Thermoplasmatota archaeon]
MRALLPLAALALAALAAPTAAADESPWTGVNDSWNAMADEMQQTPRDSQDTMVRAEEQGSDWCMWSIEAGEQGADNAREQASHPPW